MHFFNDVLCNYTYKDVQWQSEQYHMLISIDMHTGMEIYQLMNMGMILGRIVLHIKGAD